MNRLESAMIRLADLELETAVEKWGLNHSNHESVAVFREEVEEAGEEMNNLGFAAGTIWDLTKKNADPETMRAAYEKAYHIAVNLACEAIQAAAMARKGILSNIEIYKEAGAEAGQSALKPALKPATDQTLQYGA